MTAIACCQSLQAFFDFNAVCDLPFTVAATNHKVSGWIEVEHSEFEGVSSLGCQDSTKTFKRVAVLYTCGV